MTACVHYWMIERSDGPTSKGRCKRCRRSKWFVNHVPDAGCRCGVCKKPEGRAWYQFVVKSRKSV